MKFNEESVKNNVIIPFIQEIGFSPGELEFERNFTIQLGRGVYNVKGEKAKEANGRLDILCKRDGKHLFVIELKAEGFELTDEDKKQGISYARLLDPMAPYVLLSNGDKSILYETISGNKVEALNQDYFIDGFIPNLDEELSLRFEALKNFIGYSYDNLLNFCKITNQEALKKFRAEPSDEVPKQIQQKYIASLYVERKGLENCFEQFLRQNDKCVFAIVGESGVGKTNTICHLAETISSEPTLFLSGSILGNSILKELVANFNLVFSSQESEISVLKKISALAKMHRKSFVIFFDAIDEWIAEDKVYQINQLIKYFKRLNIKICISCKDLIWNSFITQSGIPTDLSDNLYPNIPILTNFDAYEVKEAIDKYSGFLGIESTTGENLVELQNPFSLRVACEVSYNDKVPLNLSRDSRTTLSRYIALKLEKTSNPSINFRFLEKISISLLKYGKVQIFENEIRQEFNISIYDEIPQELFSFNFLYKYLEENGRASIGFYFSGIRDYIVGIQILELDIIEGGSRLKKIKEAFSNFIGENAVMYFFKTGNNREQEDCIKAAIEFDRTNQKSILSKLLSWYGNYLNDGAKKSLNSIIIDHLKFIFERYRDNLTIAEQVIDAIEKLECSTEVEFALTDFFTIMLKSPQDSFCRVSHRIAILLKGYDGKESTAKLIQLVLNQNHDGYVRRYIVESLENRTIDDRKALFLQLIIDPDGNVRWWVRSWYNEFEDNILRDKLLEIFDNTNSTDLAVHIALTLWKSDLKDTGEKLFNRFINKNYDEEVTIWLCRAIAGLEYKEAIPKYIDMLKANPYSELSEHILIALGDLKATEAMPVLLGLIESDKEMGLWWDWLSYAFSKIASEQDYQKLKNIILKTDNANAIFFSALTLAKVPNKDYNQIICKMIADKRLEINQRKQILQEWGENLAEEPTSNGTNMVESIPKNNRLSIEELNSLYGIIEQNNEMSPIALGLLMNLESDVGKLSQKIIKFLPLLKHEFSTRTVLLNNSQNLEKLAKLIKPWLNKQLFSKKLDEVFISNCMQLAGILGDTSTLEAINANREKLVKALNENYVDYIEHIIRNSSGKIRLILDD